MQVSSELFTYDAPNKVLVTELSDLGKGFRLEQIYQDSADAGFTMVSARTGKAIDFVECGRDMNGDEIAGWRFEPKPEQARKHPEIKGLTALIIND